MTELWCATDSVPLRDCPRHWGYAELIEQNPNKKVFSPSDLCKAK